MNALRTILYAGLYAALVVLAGCGSPLVGLECLDGYEQCDNGCYDMQSDPLHCGGCDIACAADQQCVASACVGGNPQDGGDGGPVDGGDGGARDTGPDTGRNQGDATLQDGDIDSGNEDGGMDARTDADTGSGDADTGAGDTGMDGNAGDGSLTPSDGAVALGDGAFLLGDGAIVDGDGSVIDIDGSLTPSDGAVALGDGAFLLDDGAIVDGDGSVIDIDGSFTPSDGSVPLGDGAFLLEDGAIVDGDGSVIDIDGAVIDQDGDVPDGGDTDGSVIVPTPPCTGPAGPDPCVCDFGGFRCPDLTCVDLDSTANCGACGNACMPNFFCINRACVDQCPPPSFLCPDGRCVDLTREATCGGCDIVCEAAAACIDIPPDGPTCVGQAVGHVVVVGHDMSAVRTPMNTIVGNAVFLARSLLVRVLVYDEFTNLDSRIGVLNAIAAAGARLGRDYNVTNATRDLVPSLLPLSDVLVIDAQHTATDADLITLGHDLWAESLHDFLHIGGVIVLFDAGGVNDGTYQILTNATRQQVNDPLNLFDDQIVPVLNSSIARDDTLDRPLLRLLRPGDAVGAGVPTRYQSEGETAGFTGVPLNMDSTIVVDDPEGSLLPVVLHVPYIYVD